jgi:acetyltransferase-like isoleucine patch superfamily enzyme
MCWKGFIYFWTARVYRGGRINIGDNTRIARWCVFREYGGSITIGSNCSINSFCHFSGNGGIRIGDNVLIATQCVLISANHSFDDITKPISSQGETRAPIIIENDCWLGAGVKVLMGVRIGKGSVIGAGSVVTHDVPPYSVVVGVPGRIIKCRVSENSVNGNLEDNYVKKDC